MRTHGVTGEAPRSLVARAVSEGDFHPASRPPRTTEYEVHASGARAPSQADPHVPNASASAKPPEETARRTHARTLRSNARKQADRDMSRTRAHSDRDLHLQLQPVRCATHAADVAGAWPPLGETRKLVWAPHPQVDGSISTGRPDALDAQL